MIRSGLSLILLAGCGQPTTNLKYKTGECTYAGNGTDWKSDRTNTDSDGRIGRASGETRGSNGGTETRSIEEVLRLHRRVHRPDEFGIFGHRVGEEQNYGDGAGALINR